MAEQTEPTAEEWEQAKRAYEAWWGEPLPRDGVDVFEDVAMGARYRWVQVIRSRKTLDEYQAEIGAWGDATFPKSTFVTVAAHFEEEAAEFMQALRIGDEDGALEEAADCFILLMQFAHKSGFSLFDVAESKMAINRQRTWKTTPEPDGHTKHDAGATS